MPRKLAELIEIPERVHKGDFVLRLTEGVTHPEATLSSYVVTPQLADCFDGALAFIKSALDGGTSKAAYLHGSFGSGKSHFMAVLHLLLQREPAARGFRDLQPLVHKHDPWLQGRKFLLVPYHMIGARSMEAAVLGGYVEHVRRHHADAPLPGVYLAEHIFGDARNLRTRLGDAAFFDALSAGDAGGGGWGALGTRWDAMTFDAAVRAAPTSPERTRLVGDLVTHFFSAYKDVAVAGEEAFVSLDDGLSIIAQHAKSLGYDALVLFLDELILWLASHMAQMAFVTTEGQKLAKLVEAQRADRPIPIVSFVARQRDLRELVGEHAPGAEGLAFADVLKWWEQRFHTISLEDRNLPAIAEKRVLRPRSEAARIEIDQAFRETQRVREEVRRVLLGSDADDTMFRQVYPFSPALVQALVAVSSVLQRERTALKVMVQLLVDQRDALELGQLVPVGDLFDVIAEGDQPFSEEMRIHFENAKKLYFQKLLPLLEEEHGARAEALRKLPRDDAQARAFQADDRLVKTLLLSALVPEVEALRSLTGTKLAALNHGSIRAPIPGQEGQLVLAKCRKWAARIGEIKLGDGTNPTVSVQVTGVDTESILAKAQNVDNVGARRAKIRELVFGELGIHFEEGLFHEREIIWRGTRRRIDVVYGNVRELPDESLRAGADWKLVIDFPFDVDGYTAADDLARVDEFRQRGEASRTLCWVPSFLSLRAQDDLGTLIKLDHILAGERFDQYASHLTAVDRQSARILLQNRQSTLKQQTLLVLGGSYGVTTPIPESLDGAHEPSEAFQSLEHGFEPRPPVAPGLGPAIEQLLDQMLAHQFPEHPNFGAELRPALLRRVHGEVQRAIHATHNRITVDRSLRNDLRAVADPLELGTMHEDAFVLGHRWRQHFLQKAAADGGPITVKKLRGWMDEPRAMGLTKEAQNLTILVFAEQANRSFFLHGGPLTPTLEQLPDEVELREQTLPTEDDWRLATARAAAIFGVPTSPLRNSTNVAALSSLVKSKAGAARADCNRIAGLVSERLARLGADAQASDRQKTANASLALVEALESGTQDSVISTLAHATIATSAETMATSIAKASDVNAALAQIERWDLFEGIARLSDERATAGQALLQRVREALRSDELAAAIGPALEAAAREAVRLLAPPTRPQPPQGTPPMPPPPPPRSTGLRVIETSQQSGLALSEATRVLDEVRSKLSAAPGRRLSLQWEITEEEPKP